MAGRGRKVTFHGAYGSKTKARRKEHQLKHSYIRKTTIRHHTRWLVLKRRGK